MGKGLNGKELGKGISQRKDGTYCGRYTDRFGKRRSIYKETLSELRDALNVAIYENQVLSNTVFEEILVDDWFAKWMKLYKRKTKKHNTVLSYESLYRNHIKDVFGDRKLVNITQLQVLELLNRMDDEGYSLGTRKMIKAILGDMLETAVVNNFLRSNPAYGIKIESRDDEEDFEEEIHALTLDEQTEFFQMSGGSMYNNAFIVQVNTGLRPGELMALKEKDLDFKRGVIKVRRTLLYTKKEHDTKMTFYFGTPKSKSSLREIPMNLQCENALKQQLDKNLKERIRDGTEFQDLIFKSGRNRPVSLSMYNSAIKTVVNKVNRAREKAGVKEKMQVFTGHGFRHTFATRCFEADIKPKTVQKYLGHRTLAMTMNIYTHVMNDHEHEEMDKLDAIVMQSLSSTNEIFQKKKKQHVDMSRANGVKLA